MKCPGTAWLHHPHQHIFYFFFCPFQVSSLLEEHLGPLLQPPGETLGMRSPFCSPSITRSKAGRARGGIRAHPPSFLPLLVTEQAAEGLSAALQAQLWLLAGDSSGAYDLPEGFSRRGSAAYHDYAELQSFQSDFSYDNLWEAEGRAPSTPRGSPTPSPHFYQA